jgi:hypothetical protein
MKMKRNTMRESLCALLLVTLWGSQLSPGTLASSFQDLIKNK